MNLSAQRRLLLETLGAEIYTQGVTDGFIDATEPRYAAGAEQAEALTLLGELGLMWLDETSQRYFPVDPGSVQSAVVVPLANEGNALLNQSAEWSEAFHALGRTFRASPQATVSTVTEIHGVEKINAFLTTATSDCRTELLTAQPYGRRPTSQLSRSEDRDMQALERGVRMRTLYQHSSRHGPATREYVGEMIKRGAEVRTLDEFFRRLFVFDRQIAVIPASEEHAVAIAIYDKAIVGYLVDVFERAWERGMAFTLKGDAVEHSIAADVRAMTTRLLSEGHSDAASAKRLGVSTRTYAGYIATLKDEYGVQTRFQLGWAMAQDAEGAADDKGRAEVLDPLEGS